MFLHHFFIPSLIFFLGGGRVKEKNKYYCPSIPLSPDFIDILSHIVLCHQTKKQFEKTNTVNN